VIYGKRMKELGFLSVEKARGENSVQVILKELHRGRE